MVVLAPGLFAVNAGVVEPVDDQLAVAVCMTVFDVEPVSVQIRAIAAEPLAGAAAVMIAPEAIPVTTRAVPLLGAATVTLPPVATVRAATPPLALGICTAPEAPELIIKSVAAAPLILLVPTPIKPLVVAAVVSKN
jgi:hypothetical protein